MPKFAGAAEPLTAQGFRKVLADLDVEIPELLAVLAVESKACGYLPDRRPIILFERHIFHKRTGGRFSRSNPDISSPEPGGYAGLAREYPRLEQAAKLDRTVALMSASWGAGQIMGFNYAAAGFANVETMVAAMQESEDAQLTAIANFIESEGLTRLLRARDWAAFARKYNGPAYAKNKYDVRLAGAYEQYASGALPNIDVRRAQLYLTYLGYAPGAIDGLHGKLSRSAVAAFRAASGLENGDRVNTPLLDALQARVRAL